MSKTVRVNATMDEELVRKIDFYAEENLEDRSTAIRQLIAKGLKEELLNKIVERIEKHRMTLRQGAELLGVEYWELQEILEERGVAVIDTPEREIEERKESEF